MTLLHRQGRSFTFTPAGNYFYRHGKAILKEAEQVKKETLNWSKSTSKIKVKINKRKKANSPPPESQMGVNWLINRYDKIVIISSSPNCRIHDQ